MIVGLQPLLLKLLLMNLKQLIRELGVFHQMFGIILIKLVWLVMGKKERNVKLVGKNMLVVVISMELQLCYTM